MSDSGIKGHKLHTKNHKGSTNYRGAWLRAISWETVEKQEAESLAKFKDIAAQEALEEME